jgi:hypothetical protein
VVAEGACGGTHGHLDTVLRALSPDKNRGANKADAVCMRRCSVPQSSPPVPTILSRGLELIRAGAPGLGILPRTILFVHHVDSGDWQDADFQSADALSYFAAPDGWTYATRILEEELALDSDNSEGVVTVLAIRGAINSTWERR